MSLLNKFKNIEVNINDMLSDIDKEFLDDTKSEYDKAFDLILDLVSSANKIHEEYEKAKNRADSLLWNVHYKIHIDNVMKETISYINTSLIHKIIGYFEVTYNINLSELKEEKNYPIGYKTHKLSCDKLVENIFTIGLNGKSFEDIRIEQLKRDIDKIISHKKVSCNKNKLTINDYMWFSPPRYSWSTDHYTSSYSRMKYLALALKEFCNCPIELIYKVELDEYETHFNDIGGLVEVNFDCITSYKLFKNGKLEINFNNHNSAVEFAKEWLNKNV